MMPENFPPGKICQHNHTAGRRFFNGDNPIEPKRFHTQEYSIQISQSRISTLNDQLVKKIRTFELVGAPLRWAKPTLVCQYITACTGF